MEKETDNSVSTRKIKLIARHYGKGRLVRQCISCFALLINVFTWWWNNETTRREARSEAAEMNDTLAEQIAWAQITTAALADLFGIADQVDEQREVVLNELIEKAKQEIIHEHETK